MGLPWCSSPANQTTINQAVIPATPPVVLALTNTSEPTNTPIPTIAFTPTLPAATGTPKPEPSATAGPVAVPVLGGADKVAFIASNEVWLMNLDGSELKVLTNDKAPKSNLQWIPGTNQLVFISLTNVNTVDADTGKFDTLLTIPFATSLDEFRLSPDGKQVAISLNHEMYIVPFDPAKLKSVRGKEALIAMKGCLSFTANTLTTIKLKEFRWSKDSKMAAWLFQGAGPTGKYVDLIRTTNISSCDPTRLSTLDEFPGTRFTPEGYGSNPVLSDFDWDGNFLFLMNTSDRNNGWGYLYTYSTELHKGTEENPIASTKSRCCYRDATWSPDGSYVFFAFQSKDNPKSPQQFFYVPANSFRAGVELKPIPMPADFFTDPKEGPQPALHIPNP